MRYSLEILEDIEKYIKWMGGTIKEKESSRFMRLIAFLIFFNKNFMRYTTTIFSTVYVPKEFLDTDRNDPNNGMHLIYAQILTHEAVHIHDFNKLGLVRFVLKYLEPQVLVVFSLGALGAIWNTYCLFLLVFLLALLPIPSIGRKSLEMRGYAMTMAFDIWIDNLPSSDYSVPEYIIKQFTGWFYYRMWPFDAFVKEELDMWLYLIKKDKLQDKIKIACDIKGIVTGKV